MTEGPIFKRVCQSLGITTVVHAGRNVHLLLATRLLRMCAYGFSTLILALYFAELRYTDTEIGLFMTLTLLGDVLLSLLLTLVADRLGRRRILGLGSLLMTFSGLCFAMFSSYTILLLAAIVGVISPSGNEIGPFRAIEESTMAHLSEAQTRSDIFAWYVVLGTLGSAMGALACGWITQTLQTNDWSALASFRLIFWLYAAIGLVKAAVTLLLDRRCEVPEVSKSSETADGSEEREQFLPDGEANNEPAARPEAKRASAFAQISPQSRSTLARLCALFFFDSLASGMVPNSLIVLYFERKFSASEGWLGSIISTAQFMSSIGNVFASAIAKRIGLVRTMVTTHLPSAIFLALIPAPSSLFLSTALLVARASLASMDQAPRSAFLSAVVVPEERTAVMGIVNTVKTLSQSAGPSITGGLAGSGRFWIAFVAAGSLKAGYDLMMLRMFLMTSLERHTEEQSSCVTQRDTAGKGDSLHGCEASEDEIELEHLATTASTRN